MNGQWYGAFNDDNAIKTSKENRNSDVIPRGFSENDTRFPLTPMSDWHLISPSNNTPASHIWGHEKKKWLPVKEALGC